MTTSELTSFPYDITQLTTDIGSIRPCFTFLGADNLFLRCEQRKVGHKQLDCNATNYSTYSIAIIVDQFNRVMERIAVKSPIVVFRATDLIYNVEYTVKFGTGEQKIRLYGMYAKEKMSDDEQTFESVIRKKIKKKV